jgi:hypothetical protein
LNSSIFNFETIMPAQSASTHRNLFHVSMWLLMATIPTLALALVFLVPAQVAEEHPKFIGSLSVRGNNFDNLVIGSALDRAKAGPQLDIALLGDSTCLLGIDPMLMRAKLMPRTESFCSLGFVGPEGYSIVLEHLVANRGSPKNIVIGLHPASFKRYPKWSDWVDRTRSWPPSSAPARFPFGALALIRELVARILFLPLPSNLILFYGSPRNYLEALERNYGGVISTRTGLNYRSLDEVPIPNTPEPVAGRQIYDINQEFLDALDKLRLVLKSLHATRIFLVITPISDRLYPKDIQAGLDQAGITIADHLGVPTSNILHPQSHFPSVLFNDDGHVNRWGRVLYTNDLIATLRERLVLKP